MKHNKKIRKILAIVVSFVLGAVAYAQYEDINQNNDESYSLDRVTPTDCIMTNNFDSACSNLYDLNDNSHLVSTSQSCNNSWVEFFFEPNEYIEFFVVEEFENLSVIEINEIIVTQNNRIYFNYEMSDETNLHWFDINNEISSLKIEIISSTEEATPTLKCGLKDVWFYGRES